MSGGCTERPVSWCAELCDRLHEADFDDEAFSWARDALVRHLNRLPYSDDPEILALLSAEPPNDATCAQIKEALLIELDSADARRAAQAAKFLGESADPALVPALIRALRRGVEEFMAANSAMASAAHALESCGEWFGDDLDFLAPLETMRAAQEYLKRQGYDYVPW